MKSHFDSWVGKHKPQECESTNGSTLTNIPQDTTLILGLGNVLMGDEGIGVYVVRALQEHPLPSTVECMDGGTGGFALLGILQSASRIILIDAAADGNPEGTVTRTTPRFSRDYPPTLTAHDIGVKDLLDVFYIQGGGPEVILYAITIDPKQPIRMSLSEQGQCAANLAVNRILAEIACAEIACSEAELGGYEDADSEPLCAPSPVHLAAAAR
jgi:hydrogenase maturation protease